MCPQPSPFPHLFSLAQFHRALSTAAGSSPSPILVVKFVVQANRPIHRLRSCGQLRHHLHGHCNAIPSYGYAMHCLSISRALLPLSLTQSCGHHHHCKCGKSHYDWSRPFCHRGIGEGGRAG